MEGCHNRLRRHKVTKDRDTVKDTVKGEMEEEEMAMEEEDSEEEETVDKVAGLGECNEVIDEIALKCLGWMDFKADMWAKYRDLTRDEIEDDIIFDNTDLGDFEDSIRLCSEKRRWGERKMLEQVMRRITPREYEAVKKIKEESDTRGSFLVKMRKAYPLEVQRQKKKQLLQEQGLWIDKRGERIERRAQMEDRGNITAPQQGNDEYRAQGEDDSIKEDKTQMGEHDGKEVEGNGKAGKVKKGDEKVKGKEKDSEKNEMAGPSETAEESTSNELIRLNELPRDDCEWILEGEAEVDDRLKGVKEERRRELEVPFQELQDRMKEKTELFTQGVASHVPEILKETQRLRAREEKKDMQWAKVEKEMESLKAEMEKAKIEQGKMEVKVEALSIALDNKRKEAETEKIEKEKLEKEVEHAETTERELTSKRADRIKDMCHKAGIRYITRDQTVEELVRAKTDLAYEGLYEDGERASEVREQVGIEEVPEEEGLTAPRPRRSRRSPTTSPPDEDNS
ncbi:hypothetical protein CBR_g17 [Chara braunii]|uniref:Uncharacterized protein n=1 Tax=Chara braunii TaxID=69332 RepID=A0A388JLC2_CHABU|nr:hypothetical protein CBR_g17 [Chara braunii]|eukprot:GBG58617.1 hypothetical protein CBR_g17 [Chara braunii]